MRRSISKSLEIYYNYIKSRKDNYRFLCIKFFSRIKTNYLTRSMKI